MEFFYELKKMLREDLDAILPGTGEPFTREAFMRILPYLGLLLFVLRILFPGPLFSRESPDSLFQTGIEPSATLPAPEPLL